MNIPLLTIGEAKVYDALNRIGESSVGHIIQASGVSHSKIYEILKRLGKKGLVSTTTKNGRTYFLASHPSALHALVAEEKERIQETEQSLLSIQKQLEVRRHEGTPELFASYEGLKGMKHVVSSIVDELNEGEEVLIMGSPRLLTEQLGGYIKAWQQARIKKKAICKILADKDAVSWNDAWWKKSKTQKLTFSKRSSISVPAYLIITDSSVTTVYFSTTILCFHIKHKLIAQSYKQFFYQLWKVA